MVLPLGDVEKTRITPWITYALIALNVVMFLVQVDRGDTFTVAFAATPWEITHGEDITEPFIPTLAGEEDAPPGIHLVDDERRVIPQAPVPFPVWLTLFTAMFLHGDPLHLAGNMLFLWIYGDNVEEVLGEIRYLLVYLTCGLAGSLCQIVAAPDSLIPTLGASGAIAGVMGMYVVWFPYNRVRVLIFRVITELPAILVIGVWIALQLFQGFGTLGQVGVTGGVAYLAHVGGAAAGIAAAFVFHDRARALILARGQHFWGDGR